MQLEVTENLKEALGKYRTARRAYVSLGAASPVEEDREVSVEYQTALEALGYQFMVEAELQGLKVQEIATMAAIDPNQTADKLIVQRASASAGYKGAAVRVADGKIGLCTSTYNHSQDDATKAEIARRVAALWNLAVGIPTAELEAADASGFKLRK